MYSAGFEFGIPPGVYADSVASVYDLNIGPETTSLLDHMFKPDEVTIIYDDLSDKETLARKQGSKKLVFASDQYYLTMKSCDFHILEDLKFPSDTDDDFRHWPTDFFNSDVSFAIRRNLTNHKNILNQISARLLQTGNIIGIVKKYAPEVMATAYVKEYCHEIEEPHIRVYTYGDISAHFKEFASIFVLWSVCLASCFAVFVMEGLAKVFHTQTPYLINEETKKRVFRGKHFDLGMLLEQKSVDSDGFVEKRRKFSF